LELEPLFEGHFITDCMMEMASSVEASKFEDGDWMVYLTGAGTIKGERVEGKVVYTGFPRRRADGMILPAFRGFIKTADGETIMFDFQGYNRPDGNDESKRVLVGAITFQASGPKYGWLSRAFGTMEARATPQIDGLKILEDWHVRAFSCVNTLGP
jgi:Protein of unknown function (DUF3237)